MWQQIAARLVPPLTVVDIGARGGIEDQWAQFGEHIWVYGFEPDQAECERLNRDARPDVTYVPFALGSTSSEQRFYVTKDPFCSSLYPPVDELVDERPRLADNRVEALTTINTRTIDEWMGEYGIDRLDHIKVDAQGAELAILEGAAGALGSVRSLNVEVQFSRLYEDTPLFGDIDLFLRERGFVLWRLGELSYCGFENASKHQVPEGFNFDSERVDFIAGSGQLLWANAHYVRQDTVQLSRSLAWSDALRDACMAHAHHYDDLAEICLRRAIREAPAEVRATCSDALTDAATFDAQLTDSVQQLQVQVDELKRAADERLVVIGELKRMIGDLERVADERLALINELDKIAAERLRAMEEATKRLEVQGPELEQFRDSGC